jgi:hypothetical protein
MKRQPVITPLFLAVFCGFTALYAVCFAIVHPAKRFWLDELLTVYQVNSRGLGELMRSLGTGMNCIPPGYFILAWTGDHLWGLSEFAARLPSLICILGAIPLLWILLRKVFGEFASLGSIVVLYTHCGLLVEHAVEARPYGLYFLLSVAALWSGSAFLSESRVAPWQWLANAFVSFALPFTFYVGGVYSALLAGAVVLSLAWRHKLWSAAIATASFALGWIAFASLSAGCLIGQLQAGGVDATDLPIRVDELFDVLDALWMVPFIPIALLIMNEIPGIKGIAMIQRGREPGTESQVKDVHLREVFLVCAILWMGVPFVFFAGAKLDLASIFKARYFFPTACVYTIVTALIFEKFMEYRSRRVQLINVIILFFLGACLPLTASVRARSAFRDATVNRLPAILEGQQQAIFTREFNSYFHLRHYGGHLKDRAFFFEPNADSLNRQAGFSRDFRIATPLTVDPHMREFLFLTSANDEGVSAWFAANHFQVKREQRIDAGLVEKLLWLEKTTD